jgi:tetratricopeptide (TPR) repeat protein
MNTKLKSLPPLDGCRILWLEDEEIPYEMPLRPLSRKAQKIMDNIDSAEELYQFWSAHTESLSIRDQIALLQQALLIDQTNAEIWYSLACTYELEGKDWYAATNAYTHVIFLEPRSGVAWFSLYQLWAVRGHWKERQWNAILNISSYRQKRKRT